MNTKTYLITALTLAAAAQGLSAADLTGKVTLKGTAPAERTIEMDATCGKLHPNGVTTRHYMVGKDSGLANVFVYVKGDVKGGTGAPQPSLIDQVDCMYTPYVAGVVAGQKLTVKNSDSLMHNVHATPKVEGNKERNVAEPVKGMTQDFSFDKPEVLVRFKCDVHNWMFAYVGVVGHPYYAVTDKDGNFKISGLPAGKYTVEAYHIKSHGANPGVSKEVEVKDGGATADFAVEVPAAK